MQHAEVSIMAIEAARLLKTGIQALSAEHQTKVCLGMPGFTPEEQAAQLECLARFIESTVEWPELEGVPEGMLQDMVDAVERHRDEARALLAKARA